MCGIIGYIGTMQAAPILLQGLSKLEYRGYDSAGIAIEHENKIEVVKAKGRLQVLEEMTNQGSSLEGFCGIGHTRWATHGEPSEVNAHPHYNQDKSIVVVHNGIIENYQALREKLMSKGYFFESETDTEVVPHLLDYYYDGNPLETIAKVMVRLKGSFALEILFEKHPGQIFVVKKNSPMIIGYAKDGHFVASDVPAILKYTKQVYYIDDMEIAHITKEEVQFFNIDLEPVQKELTTITWDEQAAEKNGFEHFMLKEIYEQPKAIEDTISPRIKEDQIILKELGLSEEEIKAISRIYIIGCGSAYHVGMSARYVLEKMTRIPVEVDVASEFRYRDPIIEKNSLAIVVSQSGETADSIAAMKEAREKGAKVLGIVNVVGSTIAREADSVMYTWAGPEISVATTKGYSAQLAAFYLISLHFAYIRQAIAQEEYKELIRDLRTLPSKIQSMLDDKEKIQWFATKYESSKDVFFIGRGLDYGTSLEGSLKLKEVSYIHSEAYAAGELKHGTISLIEKDILVIGMATQQELYEKIVSNIVEVKSRGAYICAITKEGNDKLKDLADFTVSIPNIAMYFTTSLAIIPLQLLAYYVSIGKGLDVDKPRNLAKSVTVE
ncbi:MAG: glmS [Herbinix sp.]|jgi:glucosamine--fructose-6-phosphate aminotransferase (isomerizing)|nr:glmS [Herbinix sp.]